MLFKQQTLVDELWWALAADDTRLTPSSPRQKRCSCSVSNVTYTLEHGYVESLQASVSSLLVWRRSDTQYCLSLDNPTH